MLDKRKMGLMILRKNRAVVWLFGKCVCWLFCFVMKLNITLNIKTVNSWKARSGKKTSNFFHPYKTDLLQGIMSMQ